MNVAEFSMLVEKQYKNQEEGKRSTLSELLQGTMAALKL